MIPVNFRTVGSFDAEDAKRLSRQLVQLEENVEDVIDDMATKAATQLTPTNEKTAAYVALVWDLVICNGTFTVTLPVATKGNAGAMIGIVRKAGTITAAPVSGLVQGAASMAISTTGLCLLVSDGVGWWGTP